MSAYKNKKAEPTQTYELQFGKHNGFTKDAKGNRVRKMYLKGDLLELTERQAIELGPKAIPFEEVQLRNEILKRRTQKADEAEEEVRTEHQEEQARLRKEAEARGNETDGEKADAQKGGKGEEGAKKEESAQQPQLQLPLTKK